MGRETKILLGFLAVLGGVFLGVLGVKLLVPRPPAGAGPDIRTEVAAARPIELVEPPSLDPLTIPRRRGPARAAAAADGAAAGLDAGRPEPPATFAREAETSPARPSAARRDPFVSRAAAETAIPDQPRAPAGISAATPAEIPTPPPADGTAIAAASRAAAAPSLPPSRAAEPGDFTPWPGSSADGAAASGYRCRPGDSWWSLAERAYGDGRFYRALFAWNRTHDPRVSLAPGTQLELPPRASLEAAWPKLVPGIATH